MGEGGIGAHRDVGVGGEVFGQGLLGALCTEGVAHGAIALEGEAVDDPGEVLRGTEGNALGHDVAISDAGSGALSLFGTHLEV